MLGWVGDPSALPVEPAQPGVFTALVVNEMPESRAWTEETVHIGDCEIAPDQTYAISVTVDGVNFSNPFIAGTIAKPQGKSWGDVTGSFDGTAWPGPDRLVNVDDVVAVLAFLKLDTAPDVTAVDLAAEVPNVLVNATDLLLVLQAFGGKTYPPLAFANQGSPADCP